MTGEQRQPWYRCWKCVALTGCLVSLLACGTVSFTCTLIRIRKCEEEVLRVRQEVQKLLLLDREFLPPLPKQRRSASPPLQQQQQQQAYRDANVEFMPIGVGRSETENDSWVWLTSYSRIPVFAIQDFCSKTKEYCPEGAPGIPGSPGIQGAKGEKGERGFPGEIGRRGETGLPGTPGPRGPKGEAGYPGFPGLDGRDGLPGEPGLDGIPGRNGLDGIPGVDGIPGLDGSPGPPGFNGTDGKDGEQGPPGPLGPEGPSGLPGPRGRSGKPGLPGTPGTPGINAWLYNDTNTKSLLIPPSLAVKELFTSEKQPQALVLKEGENLRIDCAATGRPTPTVAWFKEDGSLYPLGSWHTATVVGLVLNISYVSRKHMGTYKCVASNGVPPAASHSFHVEVHFPSLVKIHNQNVGVKIGGSALLQCLIEGFPVPLNYWEFSADGRILENGTKYQILQRDYQTYKSHSILIIAPVEKEDLGEYRCVSKNGLGTVKGVITVYEIDSNFGVPPFTEGNEMVVYGHLPSEHVDVNDLCPKVDCPKCPEKIIKDCAGQGVELYKLVGHPIKFGYYNFRGPSPRTVECFLSAVGKPVFHRFSNSSFGSWMQDPLPLTPQDEPKHWVARPDEADKLFEFSNKTMFRRNEPTRVFYLNHPFQGSYHAIYNGSFYYHVRGTPRVARFDLDTGAEAFVDLINATHSGDNHLFKIGNSHVAVNVDENGIWILYGLEGKNNTVIMKVQERHLKSVEYMWNISLDHHNVGGMFIICGVLYAVDSLTERVSRIRFALDLYKNHALEIDVPFTNPFSHNTVVQYNHRKKELYTWDKGNQLSYPIKYSSLGYETQRSEENSNAETFQESEESFQFPL